MSAKSYKPQKSENMQVNEPIAAYQRLSLEEPVLHTPTEYERDIIMRSEKDLAEGRFYTQKEMDKMVEEWLN